jgi:hypothetical protein
MKVIVRVAIGFGVWVLLVVAVVVSAMPYGVGHKSLLFLALVTTAVVPIGTNALGVRNLDV